MVRLVVSALARAADIDEDAVDDLRMAVSEACANAVLSNQRSSSDAPVTVTWSEDPGRVVAAVGDRGAVYSQEAPEESLDGQTSFSRVAMSGALMRSLVDEYDYVPRRDGGMWTRLAVRR